VCIDEYTLHVYVEKEGEGLGFRVYVERERREVHVYIDEEVLYVYIDEELLYVYIVHCVYIARVYGAGGIGCIYSM